MKTKLLMAGLLVATTALLPAATNDLSTALQKGLFEEEANHNLSAAIQAYQSVVNQLDEARNLAATAVFRLGECYRKLGKTNEAVTQYERILRDFSDQPTVVAPSREKLAGLKIPETFSERLAVTLHPVPAPGTDSAETDTIRHIQELIKNSPDLINAKDDNASTALHTAAQKGQIEVARFLLANGADIEAKTRNQGWTPLHWSVFEGHKAMVDFLLSQKADVQATDNNGATPLHLAARKGFKSVMELLLDHHAEVDARDNSGETPLHYAAASGNTAIIELLIGQHADVNARKQGGATPLIKAIMEKQLAAARVLVANKAELNFSCSATTPAGFRWILSCAFRDRIEE